MKKICSRCGDRKILEEFVKDKNRPDGRASRCLLCERERVKAWGKTPRGKAYNSSYNASRPKAPKQSYDRSRYENDRAKFIAKAQRHYEEKSAFIDSLKSHPCLDCERSLPPVCMDFDHVRGVKKFKISRMVTCTQEVILAEIAKCDLVCANCHRLRTDARMAKSTVPWKVRLRAKLDSLKARPCADCGESYPPGAMEFDHVRGEKEESIGRMFGWAWQRILAEVAKCEVVCSVCHRLRTEARRAAA